MAAIPIYPKTTSPVRQVLAPFASRWTYSRLLYLALAFPLGLLYFVSLVVGLATGGSLIWTIPGLALTMLVVVAARWYGDLEAELARRLVGIEIRRPPTWYERDVPLREQAKQVLSDPSTWTGLIYLFAQFAWGVLMFVFLVTGFTVSLAFMAAPAILDGFGPFEALRGDTSMNLGWWVIDSQPDAWALAVVGLVLLVVMVHAVNAVAWAHGRWAKLMLGSRARDIPPPPATLVDADAPALPASAVAHPLIATLTPREREVLLLIARGYSNAEIAESFVVSEGTVKTHVKRLLSKLEVRDRTQAAVFAFDSGFVTPESASEPEPR